jgi:hypothetical protein
MICTYVCSLSRLEVDSMRMLVLSPPPGEAASPLNSAELDTGIPSVVVEIEMRGSAPSLDVEARGWSSVSIAPDMDGGVGRRTKQMLVYQ